MKQTTIYCDLCGEVIHDLENSFKLDFEKISATVWYTWYMNGDWKRISDGNIYIDHICSDCSKTIKEFLSNKLVFKESKYGTESN